MRLSFILFLFCLLCLKLPIDFPCVLSVADPNALSSGLVKEIRPS